MTKTTFEPITLRGITVRNRIWVPPMCQYSATGRDGKVTDWHIEHYGALARGGFGALIVEATAVVPEGRISPCCLGLWSDEQVAGLTKVVDRIHVHGATAGIQLAHAGRKGSVAPEWGFGTPGTSLDEENGGWATVAPSSIAAAGLKAPTEIDGASIDAVVAAFAAAAVRAVEAGFDFVEIHSAHGYLLHEFCSPLSNQRTDSYGGSLGNRARLLLRVVDAVRKVVPEQMPVLVRLSGTEWVDGGFDIDEATTVTGWCAERGVDLADISSAGNVPAEIPIGPGYQVRLASTVRERTGIPVAAVGMIVNAFQTEQIIASGAADVVMVGRQALRDPAFALHTAVELRADIDYVPAPYRRAFRQLPGA